MKIRRCLPFRALLVRALLALVCCAAGDPAFAAGSIRVAVSPNVLLADGLSTATVTAEIRTSSGRPARDGTEVRFYTTAGTITQVAFTSAGVARATLTSSNVPQAANISVSAGVDQAVVTVPMVSKLVETSVGGRVMRINGKYVAFSEDKRFIQADEQVKARFRGIEIEANSLQIDLNTDTVKALGKVSISSDEKSLVGDRLWLSLKSFEGYIVAVGTRQWFSAYGLTELPEKPKQMNPDFELVDLTDSKLVWVSEQANYIVGERVQVQGARAYMAGIKSLRLPYHETNLRGGFGDTGQYVGIGSEGLTLDLPIYVRMTPGASTAFHVGYGARSGGIGYFTRDRGLRVDLVQKYGFSGAAEGQAAITNMTSFDRWGFTWSHTHQLNKTTRLVTNLEFPQHRDIYGQVNLTSGMPIGTVQVALAGSKLHKSDTLAKTVSLGFETKPKPLADGKVMASVETRFFQRDAAEIRAARGFRIPVQDTRYQSVGLKFRPQTVSVGKGVTLDTSATLQGVVGTRGNSLGPAFEGQLRKQLPNNGSVALGLNYNHLATISDFLPTGRVNATFNLAYPITRRLRIAALGNMALDTDSRHSLAQLSYEVAPGWRLDMMHSLFRFGDIGDFDYQFGISRAIGNRDLSLYWSRKAHRWILEFGSARF